ncbi:MAG: hypothetical protein H0W86_09820 [Armatimonadetes bacterium]|nr:hypothetical protein [Armatimonadota bacterium]
MKFLLAAIVVLQAGAALADDVMWSTDYTTTHLDSPGQVIATPDGGALAAYSTVDGNYPDEYYYTYVVKFSSTGVFEWYDWFEHATGASLGFDSQGDFYVMIYPVHPGGPLSSLQEPGNTTRAAGCCGNTWNSPIPGRIWWSSRMEAGTWQVMTGTVTVPMFEGSMPQEH